MTVQRDRWTAHLNSMVDVFPRLIPVVKGNGYGFGRHRLANIAAEMCSILAVGTVHELDGLPVGVTALVLTPTLTPPPTTAPILTVAHPGHIDALHGWEGRVVVKLTSDMRRYGADESLVDVARSAGLDVAAVGVHPPLAGSDAQHQRQVEAWLPKVDPSLEVWVSHLSPAAVAALPTSHTYRLRTGTQLWLGDRASISLQADVLDLRPVRAGTAVGYRLVDAPCDGTLVMIGAGTANGVLPLEDGRSPFHFDRTRITLLEPPHMHTSMGVIPSGAALPSIGDWVDVQRPLTMTTIDELVWR